MGQYTFKLICVIFTETFTSGIKLMVDSQVLTYFTFGNFKHFWKNEDNFISV
jgi:hypothetical protein